MFQSQVNLQPAIGVAGDLASANSRMSEVAGPGAFIAGPGGVYVGRFAWVQADGKTVLNTGTGTPDGFIPRAQQALQMNFTDQYSMLIPAGQPVTIMNRGDFLAVNSGTVATTRHGSTYVDAATGLTNLGTTNSVMSASVTASVAINLSASTCSITACTATGSSIAGTTMTLGAVTAGAFFPGQTITGTGVAPYTTIVKQLTGATVGGAGTYQVSISQTVASATFTGSGGCFTVVTQTTGTVWVGGVLSGGSTASGTTVLANGTGIGGAGNYWVSISQAISGQAITISGGTLTVTAVGSGSIQVNEVIAGGVTGGDTVLANASTPGSNVTGTGGVGTYIVSVSETVSSGTITTTGNVDTGWKWASAVNVGELGKISTWTR